MKLFRYGLPLLLTLVPCLATAQTNAAGTWRVEGAEPPFPWELFLRVNGATVTGMVSNCTSPAVDIQDALIEGNGVRFTCVSSENRERTLTFEGTVSGDELRLQWSLSVRPGAAPPNARNARLFGPAAPRELTARRVPDGDLAAIAARVRGREFSAAENLVARNVKAAGSLFLPASVTRVRAVIATLEWGLAGEFYEDHAVARLAEQTQSALLRVRVSRINGSLQDDQFTGASAESAEAFLGLLRQIAEMSGHPELRNAPLLFWGFSRGGNWGPDFARLHPQRTIGFVLYQSGAGNREWPNLTNMPALFVQGFGSSGAESTVWKRGRSVGEPWTLVQEKDGSHGDSNTYRKAHVVVIPWMAAVIRQRLSPDGKTLHPITDDSALLGNNVTGEFALSAAFKGSRIDASWLPDELTAQGWRAVLGPASEPSR